MKRDDWIGLGASLGVHLLLLAIFALTVAGRAPMQTLGAVQVQIGAFAEGQPVEQAEASSEAAQKRETAPAPTPDQKSPPAQEESTPVNLPEQKQPPPGEDPPTEEKLPEEPEHEAPPVTEPSETPDEETEAVPESASEENEASNATRPAEDGADASGDTGASEGAEGTGDDQQKAAPYDIEGLDRTRLRGALPQYTEKVNAVIKVEITVDPQGRVVGRRLLRKANPSLERSVLETLARWRFNPLPRNAPQENQTGVVTFRFRLE